MKYTENMTFEEASKALIDELNANLATLHQNYHVEQSDWNKLYDQIANVVSEETHLPVFSPEPPFGRGRAHPDNGKPAALQRCGNKK